MHQARIHRRSANHRVSFVATLARAWESHAPPLLVLFFAVMLAGGTSRAETPDRQRPVPAMLMGAISNMAPNLFGGIIGVVPFVDVLNTMLDDTLPLTPPEWPEWGNPIESKADFETILSYSPYENVKAQAYPPILAMGGLTDPRVTYWEPAKWVARLRELKTDDNLLLLRTNMEAGHAGASGRFDALKETAIEQAFALKVAGLS